MGHSVEAAAPAAASASTKKCCRCELPKPRPDFNLCSKNRDGLQNYCRACQAERNQVWERKRRRLIKRFARFKGCEQCGYRGHEDAMEFHHRNPAPGDRSVLGNTGALRSKARLKAELAKCAVLCANCHAILEAGVQRDRHAARRAA